MISLRRVGPDDDTLQPPSNAWKEWRQKALANLSIEDVYGDLLTGEVSGENWLQCRDPESQSGVDSKSGSVATGVGEAPRGTFHSWRTEETLSVFDFMVRRGMAADFSDALRKMAQITGVPLPTPPAALPPALRSPSTRSPSAPPPAGSGYPTIVVNARQFRDILWDAWQVILAANVRKPCLFRRSGRLVVLLFAGDVPQMEFIDDTVRLGTAARGSARHGEEESCCLLGNERSRPLQATWLPSQDSVSTPLRRGHDMKDPEQTQTTADIRCADCRHAEQYREVAPGSGRYVLKVKCSKGHWQQGRKRGATDLHRVMAKRRHGCDDYRTMSDSEEDRQRYLKHLANDLPLERITYEADGEPVDITEVEAWHDAM